MEQREIPGGVLLTGVEAFSLEDTLDCGQCFVFSRLPDGGFAGTAGGHAAVLRQQGDRVMLEGVTPANIRRFGGGIWGLRRIMLPSVKVLSRMKVLHAACALRPASGCCVSRLGRRWFVLFSPKTITSSAFRGSFPGCAADLADRSERRRMAVCCIPFRRRMCWPDWTRRRLRRCAAAGARAMCWMQRGGWRMAGWIWRGLPRFRSKKHGDALRTIRGVGPKVADCVLLYGMGRYEAFPLDVWMKRAMAELFPGRTPADFGPYAGIAQQYIFHYCRSHPFELRKSG